MNFCIDFFFHLYDLSLGQYLSWLEFSVASQILCLRQLLHLWATNPICCLSFCSTQASQGRPNSSVCVHSSVSPPLSVHAGGGGRFYGSCRHESWWERVPNCPGNWLCRVAWDRRIADNWLTWKFAKVDIQPGVRDPLPVFFFFSCELNVSYLCEESTLLNRVY